MAKTRRVKCERAIAHFGLNDFRVRRAISEVIHLKGLSAFKDEAISDITRDVLSGWKYQRKLDVKERARRAAGCPAARHDIAAE